MAIGQTIAMMVIFIFFRMAPVRHLGFVVCVFGPPAKSIVFGGVYHCAKFA